MNIKHPSGALPALTARGAVFFSFLVLGFFASPACRAQFGSDAFSAGDAGTQQRFNPITGSQTESVNQGQAPMLQGATNGTIGPQAGDATVIQGVNTTGYFIPGYYYGGPMMPPMPPQYQYAPPPPAKPEPYYYEAEPERAELPEPGETQRHFVNEVIREDPRSLDLPEDMEDDTRNEYYRLIAEASGKKKDACRKPEALLRLGIAYGNMGPAESGLKALKKAYELDNSCDACLYNMGTIYSNKNDQMEALKYYNKALAVKPSSRVLFHLGLTYSLLGSYSQALKTFDRAVRLDPSDKKIYFERAVCRMNMRLYEDAILDLDKAIDRSHPHAAWIYMRGMAKAKAQKYERALADFDTALRLNDAPQYYNDRGSVFLKLKEYDAALYDFNEALHRDSSLVSAYRNRAVVYTAMGRPGPANDDLLMAQQMGSGHR